MGYVYLQIEFVFSREDYFNICKVIEIIVENVNIIKIVMLNLVMGGYILVIVEKVSYWINVVKYEDGIVVFELGIVKSNVLMIFCILVNVGGMGVIFELKVDGKLMIVLIVYDKLGVLIVGVIYQISLKLKGIVFEISVKDILWDN